MSADDRTPGTPSDPGYPHSLDMQQEAIELIAELTKKLEQAREEQEKALRLAAQWEPAWDDDADYSLLKGLMRGEKVLPAPGSVTAWAMGLMERLKDALYQEAALRVEREVLLAITEEMAQEFEYLQPTQDSHPLFAYRKLHPAVEGEE